MKTTITLTDLTNLVESHSEGENNAIQYFQDCGIEGSVTVRAIDSARIGDEDGETIEVKRYECYIDPGSVDYYYFQTKRYV